MNLISDTDKALMSQALNDLHDTFSRDIYVFKQKEITYINDSDPNFNFMYPSSSQVSGYVEDYGIFKGRIAYLDKSRPAPYHFKAIDVRDDIYSMDVRLRLDASGAAFMAGAEKISLDGQTYQLVSDQRKHGLFDTAWTDFFLKKSS